MDTKIKFLTKQIEQLIEKHRYFLLTTHQTTDGDGIGSELAFYNFLKNKGKKVVVLNEKPATETYSFLPGAEEILTSGNFTKMNFRPEVVFIFDCSDLKRTGNIRRYVPKKSIIVNIDHHINNENFGTVNWVDAGYSSVGEMCFQLISLLGKLNYEIACCLYTAILTDTGSFNYHLDKNTFYAAGKLLEYGVSPEEIAMKVCYERPFRVIKLSMAVLPTIKFDRCLHVAWMKITNRMYKSTGTSEEDTEGLIDTLRAIKGAEMVFMLKERKNEIKISMRSKGNYNVQEIAGHFKGGGHFNAAGFSLHGMKILKAEKFFLKYLKERKG